jgi:hypothetical protein
MRTWLIGIGVAVAAAALGITAAFGASKLVETYHPALVSAEESIRRSDIWGAGFPMMNSGAAVCDPNNSDGYRGRMGDRTGGMRGGGPGRTGGQEERISLDTAAEKAGAYAAKLGSGFRVGEVMEFDRNFYAVILEDETGRGAVEVLIDPYSGIVTREPGPGMMWNGKYGSPMHRTDQTGENELSLEEARAAAQEYLDKVAPGAQVNAGGFSFYGYYTFDYSIDGKTAGMLSVHGSTGDVWLHTWHGSFVAEKEMES